MSDSIYRPFVRETGAFKPLASPHLLLDLALCEAGFEPADEEQIQALDDPDQVQGILDDMEARMGVNVTYVRMSLCLK